MKRVHTRLGCFLMVLCLISCTKDSLELPTEMSSPNDPVLEDLTKEKAGSIFISYDIITADFTVPDNPADKEKLTEAEQILATPFMKGASVSKVFHEDGTSTATIEMKDFAGMPQYSPQAIGSITMPEYLQTKIIQIKNGVSSHFNSDGKLLQVVEPSQGCVDLFKEIIEYMEPPAQVPDDKLDWVFLAFEEAGYKTIANAVDPNLHELHYTNPEGELARMIIDRSMQKIVGRLHYDKEGTLETLSNFIHKDNSKGGKELSGHRFISFYTSPESGVRMSNRKFSQIQNFNLEIIPKK